MFIYSHVLVVVPLCLFLGSPFPEGKCVARIEDLHGIFRCTSDFDQVLGGKRDSLNSAQKVITEQTSNM